jgi:hypothetical protein
LNRDDLIGQRILSPLRLPFRHPGEWIFGRDSAALATAKRIDSCCEPQAIMTI